MTASEWSSVLLATAQVLASLAALVTAVKARRAADAAREAADAAHDKAAEACREQLIFALRDAAKQKRITIAPPENRNGSPNRYDISPGSAIPLSHEEVTSHV